jgi:hypothetical protein
MERAEFSDELPGGTEERPDEEESVASEGDEAEARSRGARRG